MSASNSNQFLARNQQLEQSTAMDEQQESPGHQEPGSQQSTAAFNLLQIVKKRQTLSSDFQPRESYGFIVGQRACGKTTLMNRWLDKTEGNNSVSQSFAALEYSYARKNRSISTLKDVVHLWEYSGDDLSKWMEVPLNENSLQDSFVVVCCDLSSSVDCFKYAFTALSQVHQYLDAKLDNLEKRGSKRPKAMRASALKRGWSSHPDASAVKPCPIQLALFGLKFDKLQEYCDDKVQRIVIQSMRWLAHSFGATLLLTSHQDEPGIGMAKKLLNNFAFRSAIKAQPLGTDPRYIPAAADSFADMSLPPQLQMSIQSGGPLRAYTDVLALLSNQKFRVDNKNAKDATPVQQYPDSTKYPEDLIDSLIADMRILGK